MATSSPRTATPGDGVNVAARVESESRPGGVCLSGSAFEQVWERPPLPSTISGSGRSRTSIGRFGCMLRAGRLLRPRRRAGRRPRCGCRTSHRLQFCRSTTPTAIRSGIFADGMTEDIITTLSYISSLFVIARNSSFAYKGKARDLRQIGQNSACAISSRKRQAVRRPHQDHRPAHRCRRRPSSMGRKI